MDDELRKAIERAAAVLKDFGAREVYIFGSAAGGTMREGSDVDLAVVGLPPGVFFAALASGLCTGLALLVGLLTRIRLIRRLWCASWVPAAVIVAASLLLMSLGSALGLVETYTNPDTEQSFKGLHYMVALTAYFAMIFAIANWPIKKAIG